MPSFMNDGPHICRSVVASRCEAHIKVSLINCDPEQHGKLNSFTVIKLG